MSTRAIKKLTKKQDLENLHKLVKEEDESEEEENEYVPVNKFNLLNQDSDKQESETEANSNEESIVKEAANVSQKSSKKKKKKQAKKFAENQGSSFNFVSQNIDEDDELVLTDMASQNLASKTSSTAKMLAASKKLLQVESKYLNSDNEMIRKFGAKIVQAEKNNNRHRNQRGSSMLAFKQNAIVVKKPTWPEFSRHGLSMKILVENSNDNVTEFTFEHSPDYQKIQFAFLDAVESLDHNNIINVLHMCPYHIDSLIQMSDISRMSDDTQMAADLIERALYAIQNSFHPSFNITFKGSTSMNANHFKLDYNRVENRGFFIVLLKQIIYVGGKACYRTALELSKLLLGLDVEGDPLGAILLIDFYAIRSSQYEYLIEFYETFNPYKHLNLMPNMIYSVALAHHYLYTQTGNESHLEKGEKFLQEALMRFPSLLLEMLDKCGVMPDKQVDSHNKIFTRAYNLKVPEGLKYLIDLYVTRMHYEWKIAENIQWLEKNVKQIIAREKSVESFVNENRKKCKTLFSKVPPNLYRHLILSDLKEVAAHLPPEFSSTATYTFDPIPPKNTIISYTRPIRPVGATSAANATPAETLLTFFQSLMPSFNVQNIQQGAGAANNDNDEPNLGAQAAGLNRFDMQQMVGRLREFVEHHIDQNFPAANPLNNNANNPNNDDLDDDFIDEFD